MAATIYFSGGSKKNSCLSTKAKCTVLVHDYAGHPFQVQLSRELALCWKKHGYRVVHGFSSSTHTPQGSLSRRDDDPLNLEITPISLGKTIDKYSFLSRFKAEQRYGELLVEHCARIKPDVVLSGNTPTLSQCKLVQWGLRNRVPIVTWIQDMYGLAAHRILKKKMPVIGGMVGKYLMHLDAWCYKNSQSVVPITDDFIPQLKKYGVQSNRIKTVGNWSPLDEFPVVQRDNAWVREHNLSPSFRFLYSGTLSIRHNPKILLDLAKEVEANGLGEVIVVSEGDAADWLKKEGQSIGSLRVFPFQPFEELPNVLGAADVLLAILEPEAGVFCVPSKILTYLCAGRALLTAIPPTNEAARLISEQSVGFNVDPGDSKQFIEKAFCLARDDKLRCRFGTNAREYAESQFDITSKADQFSKILMLQNWIGFKDSDYNTGLRSVIQETS